MDISFSATGRVITVGAECMMFQPSSGRYNGGSGGGINLKRFSVLPDIGHFIRPDTHLLKTGLTMSLNWKGGYVTK